MSIAILLALAASPVQVSEAYFDALEKKELKAAGALFTKSGTVFESGKSEGTWNEYRTHHLAPEIEAIKTFEIERRAYRIVESEDGTLSMITWTIGYAIALSTGRKIRRAATVTFVLRRIGGRPSIEHLHWSSRAPKKSQKKAH